jgi:signal transduction histidine kinase
MRARASDLDDGAVSTAQQTLEPGAGGAPAERPRLYRRPDAGLLGGVASGLAIHQGVRVARGRVLFAILACAGGLGVALYGAYWIVLPTLPDAPASRLPRWLEYLIAAAGAVAAIAWIAWAVPLGGLFAPALLACLGGALIWRQASESERGRWRRLSRTSLVSGGDELTGRVRLVAGAVLVIGGAVLELRRADFSGLRDGLLAMVVTVLGLALLTGPWWMRLVAQLGAERSERIRSQERADIAAHLHDSVLQTLALIQRNARSPREVTRLARGQERELRTLLYGAPAASGQLSTALRTAAAEVEDAYALAVDVVVVGDATLDEALAALCAAAREALVNAAKHSGAAAATVYAEVEPGAVTVFVRDRGSGFDPDRIAEDRQGVRGSIIARVERHGGRVRIRSGPGSGTEVEMRVPR